MNASTVAVDLAKNVFQLAVADSAWHVVETQRLTRAQFERRFDNRVVGLVVMEACGSAHHWARRLISRGIAVKLLPPAYVRAYARSVLQVATVAQHRGKTISGLRQWSLAVQSRSNHNKATCALANKIARICYATLRDGEVYRDLAANAERTPRPEQKLNRERFAMPG